MNKFLVISILLLQACSKQVKPSQIYILVPENLRSPPRMKMISGTEGYYQCGSKGNVCVLNSDWKAQVYNKENLEYAHREILKIIDEFNNTLQSIPQVPTQTDKK
jgi:hypothetical protein